MAQYPLPLSLGDPRGAGRIVVGNGNAHVVEAFARVAEWPFRTAVLCGPPRSGKSLLARHFTTSGFGAAVDDAQTMDETALFHRWNAAQEAGEGLLLVAGEGAWPIALPDLASRVGAALMLRIGAPDDAMLAALIESHAAARGLALGEGASEWLRPRIERSHAAVEAVIATADRISLARKQPVTIGLLRDALAEIGGEWQLNLL